MTQGGRTTVQGYGMSDGVRQQFTSKERDNETGLDYFGARYYSSVQGRFTGVDPEQEGARKEDPQSWNGYEYARNNPLRYTDPDGRAYLVCDSNGKHCQQLSDEEFYAARKNDTKNGFIYTGSRDFFEDGAIKTSGGVVVSRYVQTSIDTDSAAGEQRAKIFALRQQTAPIGKGVAAFFGISLVAGGTAGGFVYALGASPGVTTLGLATRAGPAAAGAAGVLSQVSRTDGEILEKAAENGAAATNSFLTNVEALARAVVQRIPGGRLSQLGRIGDSPIYGSGRSGVGIAEVGGQTVVVKMVHGSPQILGPMPGPK